MRVAPPAQADACPAWPWPAVQLALVAASTAAAVGWTAAQVRDPDGWLAALGLLAGLAAAAWARRYVVVPAHRLGWDGGSWWLAESGGEPRAGRVDLMIDLGGWILLRFKPEEAAPHGTTWLPVSERSAAGHWHALRVALHGPQPVRPDTEPAKPVA